jgi:hypothetical protein
MNVCRYNKCSGRQWYRHPVDGRAMTCMCKYDEELATYLKEYNKAVDLTNSPLINIDMAKDDIRLIEIKTADSKMNAWHPHFKLVLTEEFWAAKKANRKLMTWNTLTTWKLLDTRYGRDSEYKDSLMMDPDLLVLWAPAYPRNSYFFSEFLQLLSTRNSFQNKGTWIVTTDLDAPLQPGYEINADFRLLWNSWRTKDETGKTKVVNLGISATKALQAQKPVIKKLGLGIGGVDITLLNGITELNRRLPKLEKEYGTNGSNGSDGKSKG